MKVIGSFLAYLLNCNVYCCNIVVYVSFKNQSDLQVNTHTSVSNSIFL